MTSTTHGDTRAAKPREVVVSSPLSRFVRPARTSARALVHRHAVAVSLLAATAVGAVVRLVDIGAVGYNSDEAVYAGQAASLAGNPAYVHQFPVFRAHPLLFQSLLAPFYRHGTGDVAGRLVAVAIGLATILVAYALGSRLYGRRAGVITAFLLAVMPYHVIVSRQVLLDGPATLLATVTLLVFVRYLESRELRWMVATGAVFGLAMLAKETNVLFLGAMYAVLALRADLRRTLPAAIGGTVAAVVVFASYPLALAIGGHQRTGHNYLVWQLMRQANHPFWFYETTLPWAIGPAVLLCAAAGLYLLRRQASWRELVLAAWVVVPLAALQLWPVKGYQYLLPTAPAIAVLAARFLDRLPALVAPRLPTRASTVQSVALFGVVLSLLVPTWLRVAGGSDSTFLAGTGGLPAGREAGRWVAAHVPDGSVLLTVGPSMANVLEFYSHRDAYALSISPNPLHRNPSYNALLNPDRALRDDDVQYVVWDAFSSARSKHFAATLLRLAHRYHGRVVHTEFVRRHGVRTPVIVIYAVQP